MIKELNLLRSRLYELEKLRAEILELKSLDMDQRTRMLEYINSKVGPMIETEKETIKSYIDSWDSVSAELDPSAAIRIRNLLCNIVARYFPNAFPRFRECE